MANILCSGHVEGVCAVGLTGIQSGGKGRRGKLIQRIRTLSLELGKFSKVYITGGEDHARDLILRDGLDHLVALKA